MPDEENINDQWIYTVPELKKAIRKATEIHVNGPVLGLWRSIIITKKQALEFCADARMGKFIDNKALGSITKDNKVIICSGSLK